MATARPPSSGERLRSRGPPEYTHPAVQEIRGGTPKRAAAGHAKVASDCGSENAPAEIGALLTDLLFFRLRG
jgi:hypothetical protein